MLKKMKVAAAVILASAVSANAMAAEAFDYTALTSAVDFGAVGTAVVEVAAIVAGIFALQRGVKMVLSMVKS